MSATTIGAISVLGMLVLIYGGMHVAVALALLSFAGVWAIRGDPVIASKLLGQAVANGVASYEFGVVPLFVLMGFLVSVADIGRDAFDVANRLLRRVKGGLGIATVAANTVFAAITGISIASASVFTKLAVPEMTRLGYSARFAVGVVAGSSVLGMLIPPSLLLILYGVITEQSVGKLFIAGILPGLVLALAYSLAIVWMAHYAPRFLGTPRLPDAEEAKAPILSRLLPSVALITLVLGGIYGGLFTPTEAGAAGALGALAIAVVRRKIDAKTFWQVLVETGHITASILFLILAATMYSRMLALSGLSDALGQAIRDSGLGMHGLLLVYVAVIVALGCILDSSSIMLIMVPLVMPAMTGFGVDLIWLGIVTVVAVEIGLLTPPFGISVFVIKATLNDPRVTLNDIFAGAFPFAVIMFLVLLLLIAVPGISTVLIR
ncbi:MAG: TRAP transporter large permease subunit [Alphaproteobacteria bacterium]|nr:TRAP transporter large permease subunit [Alphaproteobacteria bacterium]